MIATSDEEYFFTRLTFFTDDGRNLNLDVDAIEDYEYYRESDRMMLYNLLVSYIDDEHYSCDENGKRLSASSIAHATTYHVEVVKYLLDTLAQSGYIKLEKNGAVYHQIKIINFTFVSDEELDAIRLVEETESTEE